MYKKRLAKETEGLDGESALRELSRRRVDTMNASNSRFILRNYIAHNAIDAAEKGDFTEVGTGCFTGNGRRYAVWFTYSCLSQDATFTGKL